VGNVKKEGYQDSFRDRCEGERGKHQNGKFKETVQKKCCGIREEGRQHLDTMGVNGRRAHRGRKGKLRAGENYLEVITETAAKNKTPERVVAESGGGEVAPARSSEERRGRVRWRDLCPTR